MDADGFRYPPVLKTKCLADGEAQAQAEAQKKFALTVSLYVRDREVLQSLADEHQMSLSKFGAQLINQNREILIRAREAEAKVAEVENAAFSHMKNAHRLLGIMFQSAARDDAIRAQGAV